MITIGIVAGVLYLARTILGFIFIAVVKVFAAFMAWPFYSPPAIYTVWGFVRDFVNLFFILGLIIMAFGTIFDIKKYTYKELLMPLIISALLINFSFTIGEYAINLSNQVSNVLLTTINDAVGGNISNMLGQGLSIQKYVGGDIDGLVWYEAALVAARDLPGYLLKSAFNLILQIIFMLFGIFSFLVVIIFLLLRTPVLWILLMLSPLAWLGYAFPNLRKGLWSEWWSWFLSWVLWVPAYLLILMMLGLILKAKGDAAAVPMSAGVTDSILQVLGINDLIFFIITLVFMLGGIWFSFKIGGYFKHGAGVAGDKVMGYLGNRRIPGVGRSLGEYYRGAQRGAKVRMEDFKERGGAALHPRLAFLEGDREKRFREAQVAQRFGEHHAMAKATAESVTKEKERLLHENPNMTRNDLDTRLSDPNIPLEERLALEQIAAERGWYDQTTPQGITQTAQRVEQTLQSLGGAESEAGRAYLEKALPYLNAETTAQMQADGYLHHDNIGRYMVSQLRAKNGWVAKGVAGNAEIRAALADMGGVDSDLGQKYLESLKPYLDNDATNDLLTTARGRQRTFIGQLRAERGWVPQELAGATEMREMLDSMGGAGSDLGKKYLTSLKPFVNKETVDMMFDGTGGATAATGEERKFLGQLRAEKGWLPKPIAATATTPALRPGEDELDEMTSLLQGKELEDYLNELEKNDFNDVFTDANSKIAFASRPGVGDALKKKLYINMARKNQLLDRREMDKLMTIIKTSSKEEQETVKGYIAANIKMAAPTITRRRELLQDTSLSEGLRKVAASAMIGDNEVTDAETYHAVTKVLGETHARVIELKTRMETAKTILGIERKFAAAATPPGRLDINQTTPGGPGYYDISALTGADADNLAKELKPVIATMNETALVDVNEKYWESETFSKAILERIRDREKTKKTHTLRDGTVVPGAGRLMFLTLKQAADTQPKKDALADLELILQAELKL